MREQVDGTAAGHRAGQAGGVALIDLSHVPVARSLLRRTIGLIGAKELFLLIPRCRAVHTWFMRAPIDLVFLDEHNAVLSVIASARPWRVYVGPRGTASVLELPAGEAAVLGIGVEDVVLLAR